MNSKMQLKNLVFLKQKILILVTIMDVDIFKLPKKMVLDVVLLLAILIRSKKEKI